LTAVFRIIETPPPAIVELDEVGLVTQWNQAATQMFGWTKEELLGREFPSLCIGHEKESDSLRMSALALRGE